MKESCRLLLDSLVLHPHLAARVRQIRLELDEDEEPFRPPQAPGQLSLGEYLNVLLPTFTAVERLQVAVYCATTASASAAREILGALTSLAPTLKNLQVIIKSPHQTVEVEVSALFRLAKGLTSSHCYGPFTFVGETPTFELEELNVSDDCPRARFDALTQFSKYSLHTLRVSPYLNRHSGDSESQELDLGTFPNLQSLRIESYHEQVHLDDILSHIPNLPLRHLDLQVGFTDSRLLRYFPIPPDLPATLTHLRLDVPSVGDVTTLLDSGTCPHLVRAEFGLQFEPNPWIRIEVARAAKERGLRVIEEDESMWDEDEDDDEEESDDWFNFEWRQAVLDEFWK
ncbi:hypothetical protein RQP46_008482 [Phenoliferia psychrophenolica]